MLYITRQYKKTTAHHIGEPIVFFDGDDVTEVQADGDELEHIRHKFTNIPMSTRNLVVWYGDMAKFIVENW